MDPAMLRSRPCPVRLLCLHSMGRLRTCPKVGVVNVLQVAAGPARRILNTVGLLAGPCSLAGASGDEAVRAQRIARQPLSLHTHHACRVRVGPGAMQREGHHGQGCMLAGTRVLLPPSQSS